MILLFYRENLKIFQNLKSQDLLMQMKFWESYRTEPESKHQLTKWYKILIFPQDKNLIFNIWDLEKLNSQEIKDYMIYSLNLLLHASILDGKKELILNDICNYTLKDSNNCLYYPKQLVRSCYYILEVVKETEEEVVFKFNYDHIGCVKFW